MSNISWASPLAFLLIPKCFSLFLFASGWIKPRELFKWIVVVIWASFLDSSVSAHICCRAIQSRNLIIVTYFAFFYVSHFEFIYEFSNWVLAFRYDSQYILDAIKVLNMKW